MNSLNRFRFSLSCRGGCGSVTLYDGSATPASLSQRNAFPDRFILPFSSIRFRKNRLFLSSNCEAILSKIALIFIFSVLSEYFNISCHFISPVRFLLISYKSLFSIINNSFSYYFIIIKNYFYNDKRQESLMLLSCFLSVVYLVIHFTKSKFAGSNNISCFGITRKV